MINFLCFGIQSGPSLALRVRPNEYTFTAVRKMLPGLNMTFFRGVFQHCRFEGPIDLIVAFRLNEYNGLRTGPFVRIIQQLPCVVFPGDLKV